jgi:hypothetical protein
VFEGETAPEAAKLLSRCLASGPRRVGNPALELLLFERVSRIAAGRAPNSPSPGADLAQVQQSLAVKHFRPDQRPRDHHHAKRQHGSISKNVQAEAAGMFARDHSELPLSAAGASVLRRSTPTKTARPSARRMRGWGMGPS